MSSKGTSHTDSRMPGRSDRPAWVKSRRRPTTYTVRFQPRAWTSTVQIPHIVRIQKRERRMAAATVSRFVNFVNIELYCNQFCEACEAEWLGLLTAVRTSLPKFRFIRHDFNCITRFNNSRTIDNSHQSSFII